MTTTTDQQLDGILEEFQTVFFDADTFFKEKRRERMRPNLSKRKQIEEEREIISINELISHGHTSVVDDNIE